MDRRKEEKTSEEKLKILRGKLKEMMILHCRCGREMRNEVGERSFLIQNKEIKIDNILYSICDVCKSTVYSSETAGEIEYRLKKKLNEIK